MSATASGEKERPGISWTEYFGPKLKDLPFNIRNYVEAAHPFLKAEDETFGFILRVSKRNSLTENFLISKWPVGCDAVFIFDGNNFAQAQYLVGELGEKGEIFTISLEGSGHKENLVRISRALGFVNDGRNFITLPNNSPHLMSTLESHKPISSGTICITGFPAGPFFGRENPLSAFYTIFKAERT